MVNDYAGQLTGKVMMLRLLLRGRRMRQRQGGNAGRRRMTGRQATCYDLVRASPRLREREKTSQKSKEDGGVGPGNRSFSTGQLKEKDESAAPKGWNISCSSIVRRWCHTKGRGGGIVIRQCESGCATHLRKTQQNRRMASQ